MKSYSSGCREGAVGFWTSSRQPRGRGEQRPKDITVIGAAVGVLRPQAADGGGRRQRRAQVRMLVQEIISKRFEFGAQEACDRHVETALARLRNLSRHVPAPEGGTENALVRSAHWRQQGGGQSTGKFHDASIKERDAHLQ